MPDRTRFWSPLPDWPQAVLAGRDLTVTTVALGSVLQLSGDTSAWLVGHGLAASIGPRDRCAGSRYALRLAPDSVLLVRGDSLPVAAGWQLDSCAISDLSDGILAFDISGLDASRLMTQGSEYAFESTAALPQESARLLFAGLKVIVSQRPQGWRLHIERHWAPALWRWLQAHLQ